MSSFQLLKFILTPGEKHVGIATVRAWGKIILRFKALPSDKGGYWYTCGSTKTGVVAGKDKYDNWHQLDSDYEKEELQEFLKINVDPLIAQSQGSAHSPGFPSAFVAQPAAQPNANYGGYSQQGMPGTDPNDPWNQPNFS